MLNRNKIPRQILVPTKYEEKVKEVKWCRQQDGAPHKKNIGFNVNGHWLIISPLQSVVPDNLSKERART
jgi:hypothetical protein